MSSTRPLSLGGALKVQGRVIGAIMLRQFVTRWGRRDLGFAWLFAEPLLFAFPVLTLWSYMRPSLEHGIPLVPFMWSGYMPILLFRHVTGGAINTVKNNSAFLYHRCVTPLDLFIGTIGLEALGNIAASGTSFAIIYSLGFLSVPENYPLFIAGFLYMAWWSLSVALIFAALSERSHLVAHVWTPISYMYLSVCGFFFMADWLPTPLRNLALTIDPPLHSYEMIRAGLFGSMVTTYYDISYLTYILSALTLLGLWLMKDVREHLELE